MVRGQWGNLSRMPGLHLYSFSKDILGFLMTTESQDLSLTSHPKDETPDCFLNEGQFKAGFTRPLRPFQEVPKELVEDGQPMSALKHSHHKIRLT